MKSTNRLGNDRGSAMVISLMALVLMTLVGTYFLAQTKTETQIAGHDQRAAQALYNAEAGFGEVLARMADSQDSVNYIGEAPGTVTPGWGGYVVLNSGNSADDPDYSVTLTDGLDNDGDGDVDESGEHYPELATKQTGTDDINYPWASIRYRLNATNQVILFGDHDADLATPPRFNLVAGTPVIQINSIGGQGSANRRLEIEAAKRPFEMVQTAVYSESDDYQFSGTQFLVSGQDWDPVTGLPTGNPEVPGMSTPGDPNGITGDLGATQENNVEGDGAEPSVETSTVDLDLDALAADYASMAEIVLPGGNYTNQAWGTYDDYKIVHITGDLDLSSGVGGGLLIIDGDFGCSGTFTWYGVVIVLGDMSFTGGGGGIHIYGSTMVKGTGATQKVAGNADLLYSSAAISKISALNPYQVINWREVN